MIDLKLLTHSNLKLSEILNKEINEIPKYNYVVVNDDVDKAVLKVESILVAQKCRVDRIEEIAVENQEEILHEFIMDKEFDNTPINYNKDTN